MSFKRIEKSEDYTKIKESALRLLSRRDHSIFELKNKLRVKFKLSEENFDRLCDELKGYGYLVDPAKLAKRLADQFRSEGRGLTWIRGKLRSKGLHLNSDDEASLKEGDEELITAQAFMERRLRGADPKTLDKKEKARMARQLVSRGFSISVVAKILL